MLIALFLFLMGLNVQVLFMISIYYKWTKDWTPIAHFIIIIIIILGLAKIGRKSRLDFRTGSSSPLDWTAPTRASLSTRRPVDSFRFGVPLQSLSRDTALCEPVGPCHHHGSVPCQSDEDVCARSAFLVLAQTGIFELYVIQLIL